MRCVQIRLLAYLVS